jgi:glycosyltransferase involved in cell wall biosynthesis
VRVTHVIDSLGHGGAEQNLLTMLEQLRDDDHQIVYLYPDHALLEAFRLVSSSQHCLNVRVSRDLAHAPRSIAALVRRHGSELVHSQLLRSQIVGRVAAAATRRPSVVTWQNTSYGVASLSEFANSTTKRSVTLALDRATGLVDSRIIAVSEFVRRENCRVLKVAPEKVEVVHNALPPNRLRRVDESVRRAIRDEVGLSEGAPLLVSVGRLVEQKNQLAAIQAMPRILRDSPKAVLAIAGEGPLRATLEAAIGAEGLSSCVRLLGRRRDVGALLQAADLFVFPSLFEGLPVALVEAAAVGVACVASDIPQNREVLEGCSASVLVAPSVDAIAAAVARGLSSRRETHEDAALVSTRFAATFVAKRMRQVLVRAIGDA